MSTTKPYQPKTGQRCHCKRGQQRDNCPDCEGTGWRIDFAAIRARIPENRVERRRKAHHAALASLKLCEDGLPIWRKLRSIESMLYRVCLDYTNGDNGVVLADWEKAKEQARIELRVLFNGSLPAGLFINGDPRGHMLKLDCDVVTIPDGMERDMGGNGILAAEID